MITPLEPGKRKRLHVILVAPFFPPDAGGAGTHAFYLAQALADRRGIRVHVIAPGEQLPSGDSHWLRGPRVKVHRTDFAYEPGKVPLSAAISRSLSVYSELSSTQNFRDNNCAVVSGQHFAGAFIGMHLKSSFGIPLVATLHKTPIGDSLDDSISCGDAAYSHLRLLRELPIDHFIAGSNFFRRELEKCELGGKTSLIYHGIPATWLRSKADSVDMRRVGKLLHLRKGTDLIVCMMRWDPRKDPGEFIEAAAIIKDGLPNRVFKFLLTARPPKASQRNHLLRLVARSGIQDEFVCKQIPFELVPAVFRRAALCVVSTRREGLGLSALEALALQTPVVASDSPGIDEIITNNENGYLYPNGDPNHLALKAIAVLRDAEQRRKFMKSGKRFVRDRFDAADMAEKHESLYRQVVDAAEN